MNTGTLSSLANCNIWKIPLRYWCMQSNRMRYRHFTAWEQPELFTKELRAGFRSLRKWSTWEVSPFAQGSSHSVPSCYSDSNVGRHKSIEPGLAIYQLSSFICFLWMRTA